MRRRLIFIPGWAADASCWDGVVIRLKAPAGAAAQAAATAPRSQGLCPYDLLHLDWRRCLGEGEADNALLATLTDGAEGTVLVGWSLGAMLALSAAARLPGRVAGLVLAAGTPRLPGARGYEGVSPGVLRAMSRRLRTDRDGTLADFARLCIAGDGGLDAPARAGFVRDFPLACEEIDTAALVAGLEFMLTADLRAEVSSIRAPVAVIHGQADQVVPLNQARRLAEGLGARLEIVPSCGHALPYTRPGLVARLIADLVGDLDG